MSKKTMGRPSSSAAGVFIVQRPRLASVNWDHAPARSHCFPRRSLNHLVRTQQQRLRDREAECLGGLEVDHELELGRLFDWQVTGFCALEDLVDVLRTAARQISKMCAVREEAARIHEFAEPIHCRQPMA